MTPELLALLGLGVPALGFLARISHQLGSVTARLDNHEARLANLENPQ